MNNLICQAQYITAYLSFQKNQFRSLTNNVCRSNNIISCQSLSFLIQTWLRQHVKVSTFELPVVAFSLSSVYLSLHFSPLPWATAHRVLHTTGCLVYCVRNPAIQVIKYMDMMSSVLVCLIYWNIWILRLWTV